MSLRLASIWNMYVVYLLNTVAFITLQNRRSWHEDSKRAESQVTLSHGSESGEGGNDSDASLDDLKSQFLPRLYTCTVYITDLQTNLF